MSDTHAVLDLGRRLAEAWNAGDADGYGALFTEDADYVVFNGMHLRGRAEIAESHRWLFTGPLAGSRIDGGATTEDGTGRPESLRFLRPDVAVLVTAGGITLPGGDGPAPDRDSIQTLVAVERGGEWALASFQNTRRAADR